jgi:hypothetical protein
LSIFGKTAQAPVAVNAIQSIIEIKVKNKKKIKPPVCVVVNMFFPKNEQIIPKMPTATRSLSQRLGDTKPHRIVTRKKDNNIHPRIVSDSTPLLFMGNKMFERIYFCRSR